MVAFFSVILYAFQACLSIVSYTQRPETIPIVLSTVHLLCALGVGGLYAYLLAGHFYLIWRQISTFDYLMEKAKQRAEKRKAAKRAKADVTTEATGASGPIDADNKRAEAEKTTGNGAALEVTTAAYKNAQVL